MSTDISPSLGHGALFTQAGVTLGYDAIDLRRFLAVDHQEGPLDFGSYKVTQRGVGANLSVDIAATTGRGALVAGDSVTDQGLYLIPPHSAVINEAIAAADVTNPRNDLVILEALDDTHASGGLNKSRTRVITGTPNASATKDDDYGTNGTPALPSSAIPLAVANVPASDTTIADAQISDRRPGVPSYITTEESRTSTAFGLLATADIVRGLVVREQSKIVVGYQGMWKESVAGAGQAAIFVRAAGGSWNQVKQAEDTGTVAVVQFANMLSGTPNIYKPLVTYGGGLLCNQDTASGTYGGDVATGTLLGYSRNSADASGGECIIHSLPAGTYDVSIQSKSTSGSSTMKERKLWARAERL